MDSENYFLVLVVGIVSVTRLIIWWQKTTPPSRTEKRSSRPRRSDEPVPFMGRLNVPCDPELLREYVKALSSKHVNFLPPAEPNPPMPYPGTYGRENRCFILVAEEDCQRAEQIVAEVNQKFYL